MFLWFFSSLFCGLLIEHVCTCNTTVQFQNTLSSSWIKAKQTMYHENSQQVMIQKL